MGSLHGLARKGRAEVLAPIDFRVTEMCRVIWFRVGDGNGYEDRFDAVGVQYALGEVELEGYHVIETSDSDGLLVRWTQRRPNGTVCVMERKQASACRIYQCDEVQFVGLIFQFIRNRETGECWELRRNMAPADDGGRLLLPYYDGLEQIPI